LNRAALLSFFLCGPRLAYADEPSSYSHAEDEESFRTASSRAELYFFFF
jgi:hypothetical protein